MEEDYGHYPPRTRTIRTTSDLHLSWDVPYEPGTLEAVGKMAGKVVATEQIATTGDPAAIIFSPSNRSIIRRPDVMHLTVRIVDADQRTVPTADNEIRLDMHGPARIIGVDNGDPTITTVSSRTTSRLSTACAWRSCKRCDRPAQSASLSGRILRPSEIELNSQSPAR